MTIEETIAGVLPSGKQDPIILATSFSATGHFTPLLQISGHLADKGYDVVFLGPHAWKANIENAGCDFIPTVGAAATPLNPADYPGYAKSGLANVLWIYRDAWAGTMPAYLESLRTALASIRRTHPHRDVVIMMDVYNPGIIPLKLGASLPDGYTTLPKTLGISILPPIFTTADRGPWGFGLPYDGASESARLRNIALCHAFRAVCEPAVEATNAMLRVCGVRTPIDEVWTGKFAAVPHVPVDYGIMCHDATLQMCIPSLEYPVDEFPPHFRFGGTLPPKPMPDGFQIPDKFQQVIENSHHSESWKTVAGRKRVVTVAQGTLAVDYSDLITPTIRGLESRDDIILVVILGVKGATLSQEFPEGLPTNTIVVDYFPYGETGPMPSTLTDQG